MANLRRVLIACGIIAAGFLVVLSVQDITRYIRGVYPIEQHGDLFIERRDLRMGLFEVMRQHRIIRYEIAGAVALILLSTGLAIRIEKPRQS